ncbi:MAG: hypothetical protein ABW122_09110, partial [Ilumatobacteraceae bacterium]
HRNGHTQGDDFALYLRQARSIFDGDISQVVADNRFSVINSGPAFSPIAYPWGWPLLLAPFVHVWGLDYERLKLVEVAAFCVWLILVHGIIRRRAGRLLALAVVAVIGTAPILLAHTDQLLSEYPHAAAVAVFIWWMDRIKARHPLIAASPRSLVLLGVLAAAAYNIRREAVVLAAVILVVQVAELVAAYRRGPPIPVPWKTVATPHVAFIGAVIGFQLLIPSMLMPDNGDSPSFIRERMGDYASVLTQQLGLGSHPALGTVILLLAGAGMVIGCIRRPRLDIALTAVTVLTAMTVSTHFRMVGRYYFQIMPWVLYFATAAIVAAVQWALLSWTRWGAEGRARRGATGRARTVAASVAALPLLYVVAVHAFALPDDVSAARDFDRSGRQQVGPTDPAITPIFEAVEQHTDPTSVIAYYRARTMTLLTDRRSIQTTDIDRVMQSADYYAQMRYSDYSQPDITPNEAAALGLVEVWSDARWILWRVPDPALVPKSG